MSTQHPEMERGSKMRLFEKTSENGTIESPTPRNDDAKMPHRKIYNPMVKLTDDIKYGTTLANSVILFVGSCWSYGAYDT